MVAAAAPIVCLSVQCSGTNVYFIWLLITFQNREFNILLPLLFNSNSSYGVPSGSSNMAYFTTNTSAHQEMWAPTHQILATTTVEEYDSPKLPSFQRLANSGYPTGPSRTVMPPFNASQVYYNSTSNDQTIGQWLKLYIFFFRNGRARTTR